MDFIKQFKKKLKAWLDNINEENRKSFGCSSINCCSLSKKKGNLSRFSMKYRFIKSSLFLFTISLTLTFPDDKGPWIAPSHADSLSSNIESTPSNLKKGKKLYEKNCAVCHGPKGKGDGIGAMGLITKPRDLTSIDIQAQSDGALFWKLTTGRSPMAPYGESLSEKERWRLIHFIRSMAKK
jgi:mono/diheme cytochrome c family protein